MKLFLVPLTLLVLLSTASAPASAAANNGMNTGSLGFTCDINHNSCKCDGTWDGADCKAMAKNCGNPGNHECGSGGPKPDYCTCKMSVAAAHAMSLKHLSIAHFTLSAH